MLGNDEEKKMGENEKITSESPPASPADVTAEKPEVMTPNLSVFQRTSHRPSSQ